jgi:drug/metabolite transporter (DMT)-like permease
MPYLLLLISIILSTGRNIFSKRIAQIPFGSREFFLHQFVIFAFGGIAIALLGQVPWKAISSLTLICALIYSTVLICAQWFYTSALSQGNTALCSTVYSMGFIIPTVSGALFWMEKFTFIDLIGILCAVATIIFSKSSSGNSDKTAFKCFFIPLIIAMLSSGSLGIIQKIHQKSQFAGERGSLLLIAFILASAISLVASALCKNKCDNVIPKRTLPIASLIGLFFGCCNLLNTTLAGLLDTAIFFPTLNIGIIFLTTLSGAIIYKERITRKELTVLLCGSASILLLNLF